MPNGDKVLFWGEENVLEIEVVIVQLCEWKKCYFKMLTLSFVNFSPVKQIFI